MIPGVPEATAALEPRWPQTWVAGPGGEDIELDRIERIHCPPYLQVLLVENAA